jgi:hypothetical protein
MEGKMAIGLVVKGLLVVGAGIFFLLKLRGGTGFPQKPAKAETCTFRKRTKKEWFFYGEFPEEQEEPGDLEAIVEFEEFWILESEPVINPIPDVPMDDYLEKELERQEE